VEHWELSFMGGGNAKPNNHHGKQFLTLLNIVLPYHLAMKFLDSYTMELKIYIHKKPTHDA
jgi:hypothetical protein